MRNFMQNFGSMYKDFYLSDKKGSDCSGIQSQEMQKAARQSPALSKEELRNIRQAHQLFLSTGGAGGSWKMLSVSGLVLGVYAAKNPHAEGRQAYLDMKNLSAVDLLEIDLPFSSWCGAYAPYRDFSDANLLGCVFCDAFLEKSIFAETNLEKTDFSRANLRKVSFMNANLRGADFENCDLTGADFRGAILDGAVFAGAILDGVWR